MSNKLHPRSTVRRAALGVLAMAALVPVLASAGEALDRIRDSGKVRFAYLPQAKPFTSASASGAVEGYGVALCEKIAAQLKSQAGGTLAVEWVPVTIDSALGTISSGQADVMCTPANASIEHRTSVSFSIPVFAGGVRAVVSKNVTPQIREALQNNPRTRPIWRGTPAQGMVEATRFATVAGTTSEKVLAEKIASYRLNTATVSVPDYASGIKFLLEDKIDVFFAERDVALAAMDANASEKLEVLPRQITHDPLALGLPRGDEDLRLLVDTALSAAFSAPDFDDLYQRYFGLMDEPNRTFFSWVTLDP